MLTRTWTVLVAAVGFVACAKGVETAAIDEDDDDSGGNLVVSASTGTLPSGSGGDPSGTGAASGGSTQSSMGGMDGTGGMTATSSSVAASSSATSSVAATSVVSSSSSGGGTCNPLNPAAVCGAGAHCVPQTNGVPTCESPTGSGTQYSNCATNAQCAPIYECVQTPYATVYCLQWCTTSNDCPIFDSCYYFNPGLFVGATEWGVCWDGFP